ncbi:hypothetical protein G3I01_15945 [Gramella sp. MT6]|uniref:hypothetical protein n=1 Tax=Gramella sp. MT6 TaxID=2705471 RepID=UPI001C601B4A|nr:hypothetical protein [Gramella sp. MT6]QYA26923.1 hypothetical protein G3I01_15945 [Gramella sp. MT6]
MAIAIQAMILTMKIAPIITLLISVNFLSGQNLQGKWLLIKLGNTYSIPTNMIMEIKNDSHIYYNFDKEYSAREIKINPDKTLSGSSSIKEISFINQNRLKLTRNGIRNGKDLVFHEENVRLIQTNTELSSGEIENIRFKFDYNNNRLKVKFNEELTDLKILKKVGKECYWKKLIRPILYLFIRQEQEKILFLLKRYLKIRWFYMELQKNQIKYMEVELTKNLPELLFIL